MSIGNSIYSTLGEENKKQADIVIDNANMLADLSTSLIENGYEDIGSKLANISFNIIKEADVGDMMDGGGDKFLNFFRNKQKLLNSRIFNIKQRINEILTMIKGGGPTQSQSFNLSQFVKLAVLGPYVTKEHTQPTRPMKGTPNQQALLRSVTNKYIEFLSDASYETSVLTEFATKNPNLTDKTNRVSQALNKFITDSNVNFQRDGGYSGRTMFSSLDSLLNTINDIESMAVSESNTRETPISQSEVDRREEATSIADLRSMTTDQMKVLMDTLASDRNFPIEQMKQVGYAFVNGYKRALTRKNNQVVQQ